MTPDWLNALITFSSSEYADWGTMDYSTKRRILILRRWPDNRARAAEQDARNGLPADLATYDSEVAAIKLAIPKI